MTINPLLAFSVCPMVCALFNIMFAMENQTAKMDLMKVCSSAMEILAKVINKTINKALAKGVL